MFSESLFQLINLGAVRGIGSNVIPQSQLHLHSNESRLHVIFLSERLIAKCSGRHQNVDFARLITSLSFSIVPDCGVITTAGPQHGR